MATATNTLAVRFDAGAIASIEQVAKECSLTLQTANSDFQRTFLVAAGIRRLGELITADMMKDIMALQGDGLGFRTDKDKEGGYPLEVVKPVVIEAALRGFLPTNNEFNIIAGRFYGAKNGFERKVRHFPGLTDFQMFTGAPEMSGGNAMVQCVASWSLNGVADKLERIKRRLADGTEIDLRVPVRVNAGMGIDAILGKVARKVYAEIYQKLTGEVIPEGEVGDAAEVVEPPKKVNKSSLFDNAPANNPTPETTDQRPLLATYKERLEVASQKAEVGQVAKDAGGDKSLTTESRGTVLKWCSERHKELAKEAR